MQTGGLLWPGGNPFAFTFKNLETVQRDPGKRARLARLGLEGATSVELEILATHTGSGATDNRLDPGWSDDLLP